MLSAKSRHCRAAQWLQIRNKRVRIALIEWKRTGHCTNTQSRNESSDRNLHDGKRCSCLYRSAYGEYASPQQNRTPATEAICSERLTKSADERAGRKLSTNTTSCHEMITYPAERSDVIMDCREADRLGTPFASTVPKRRWKSGIIKHPYEFIC